MYLLSLIFSFLELYSSIYGSLEPSEKLLGGPYQDVPAHPFITLLYIVIIGGICVLNYLYKFVPDTTLVYLSIVLIPPVVSLFSKKPKAPQRI